MRLEGLRHRKGGFTLIEALTVVSIIGVLAGLTIYTITQAQRQARDAKRKSDVVAINQGFEARYADKTCSEAVYPGKSATVDGTTNKYSWAKVDDVSKTEDCPLKDYLPSVPSDPNSKYPYIYNLSSKEIGTTALALGKHFRVATHLEKKPTASELTECAYQSGIWENTFGGTKYDCSATSLIIIRASKLVKLLNVDKIKADSGVGTCTACALLNGEYEPTCVEALIQGNCCGGTNPPAGCPTSGGTDPGDGYWAGTATRYNYYLGR